MAATAILRQEGDLIDYTPAAAVSAGDVVVQGELVGVATGDIASNVLGALNVEDVFKVPKSTAAGSGMGAGLRVYWDAANKVATLSRAGGANKFFGTTVKTTADADATVLVKLAGIAAGESVAAAIVQRSTAVTNTTVETAFDQKVTVKANSLKAGDFLRICGQVIATATNSTDTLTIKVKIGGTLIVATAAVDVANNDIAYFDLLVQLRTVGAGGTFVATGVQALGTPGTVTAKPFALGSTAIDTTADLDITVTATWSVANAGDSCALDVLVCEKVAS